jgi:hypothetical protein
MNALATLAANAIIRQRARLRVNDLDALNAAFIAQVRRAPSAADRRYAVAEVGDDRCPLSPTSGAPRRGPAAIANAADQKTLSAVDLHGAAVLHSDPRLARPLTYGRACTIACHASRWGRMSSRIICAERSLTLGRWFGRQSAFALDW